MVEQESIFLVAAAKSWKVVVVAAAFVDAWSITVDLAWERKYVPQFPFPDDHHYYHHHLVVLHRHIVHRLLLR